MRRLLVLLAAVAAMAWANAAMAYTFATTPCLGQAAGFNVFTFGDLNVFNSDIEGAAAVGGNATLSNYTVASALAGGDFFVRGDLTWTNGSVNFGNGDIVHGGGLSGLTQFNPSRAATILENPFPVDFAGTETLIKSNSAYWSNLSGTNATSQFSTLTLNAGQAGLNVFHVSGLELLQQVSNLVINAAANATVLVNISGGASGQVGYDFSGFQLNGQSSSQVLFNFYEAQDVVLFNGVGIQASVVAPYADVSFNNGNLDGHIIAQSLSGNGQVDLPLFQGCPPLTAVPLPAAVWLLGSGLLGIAGLRRHA